MSAETAGLVIGLISDVTGLIEACHTVYETVENAKGISEDFQKVANSIPMVVRILENVKAIESRTAKAYQSNPNDSNKKALDESTRIIEPIFEKAIPGDDAGRIQRYWTAVKTVASGKRHKIEELMKNILYQLGLLQKDHYYKSALHWENIEGAIEELSKVKSSLSEDQKEVIATMALGRSMSTVGAVASVITPTVAPEASTMLKTAGMMTTVALLWLSAEVTFSSAIEDMSIMESMRSFPGSRCW